MTRKEAKKLEFLPVPEGFKMKYRHYYKTPEGGPLIHDPTTDAWYTSGDVGKEDVLYEGPRHLDSTYAWLENSDGALVADACSFCNPKDTPNKKLGRCIAHNRCIKAYWKSTEGQDRIRADFMNKLKPVEHQRVMQHLGN